MKSIPTVKVILDKRSKTKDNKHPVKLRVIFKRIPRAYRIPPGYYFTDKEFPAEIFRDKPKKKYEGAKMEIIRAELRAVDIINKLPKFSFELFEKEYRKEPLTGNGFDYLITRYIDKLKKENRYGTAESYSSTKKAINDFKPKVEISEITPEFLIEFEKWMLDKGNTYTTIGIYCRNIRRIFNIAISEGLVKPESYPFGKEKYRIPAGKNIKKALTLEEIKKIINYETIKGTTEDWCKDIWIFSYITNGINIADLARLKYRNVDGDYITFARYKTINTTKTNQRKTQAVLTDLTRAIIKKWGNPEKPDNFIFNIIHDGMEPEIQRKKIKQATKLINTHIKNIALKCGIDKNVTTYFARHSFATILMQNNTPIKFISDALLHSGIKMTENYLGSFQDETKKGYIDKLLNFGE
ncbi:MAG: tyrosine-type recombinase/integrase [Bacteroidota bacterium]